MLDSTFQCFLILSFELNAVIGNVMVFVVFVASTTNLDSLLDQYDVKMPYHLILSKLADKCPSAVLAG